jgi:malonyl-ACP O-methyltransferase BioC
MQTNNKHIKKQFEKSMNVYNKNASVQNLMGDKLLVELSKISNSFENILELGCGTGLLTQKIAKSIEFKTYFANDIVEKSKSYIQKIVPDVKFLVGNALKIKPTKKIDLMISNAVFQWFNNLDKAIEILKLSIAKDGILAFTTFSPQNFKELTSITGLTLEYKTKDEIIEILQKHDFEILYCEEFSETLEFKTPLELLAHLKNTGVNSLSEKTWTVKKVKDFCDKFSNKYSKTELTYAPIIIIAHKK